MKCKNRGAKETNKKQDQENETKTEMKTKREITINLSRKMWIFFLTFLSLSKSCFCFVKDEERAGADLSSACSSKVILSFSLIAGIDPNLTVRKSRKGKKTEEMGLSCFVKMKRPRSRSRQKGWGRRIMIIFGANEGRTFQYHNSFWYFSLPRGAIFAPLFSARSK